MGCGYKGLVFCKNNGWLMENMDKELTCADESAQFVCPSSKVWDLDEKRHHCASIVVWTGHLFIGQFNEQ